MQAGSTILKNCFSSRGLNVSWVDLDGIEMELSSALTRLALISIVNSNKRALKMVLSPILMR